MKHKEPSMTDEARILAYLVRHLASDAALGYKRNAEYRTFEPVEKGDLVVCMSCGGRDIFPWTVAFVQEPKGTGGALLRHISDGSFCNMSNETFIRINGVDPDILLCGKQRIFHQKLLAAICWIDDWHRYGGCEFKGDMCHVTIREKLGGMCRESEVSEPYTVEVAWRGRHSVKSLDAALRAAGVGTRKFVHRQVIPAEAAKEAKT